MKNYFQLEAHTMFKEFGQSVQLEPIPIMESKNGDEYKNFLSKTNFTVYHSRLDKENDGHIEVALGIQNISEEYNIDESIIVEWFNRVKLRIGHKAKEKGPISWPRIGLHSTEEVTVFIDELSNLFLENRISSENQPSLNSAEKQHIDEKVLQDISTRRGQKEFRNNLLVAYSGTCAISGCTDTEVLEASHITPHSEGESYLTSNGILLRADLHTLFDLFLISIDPRSATILVSSSLSDYYQQYTGKHANLPEKLEDRPSATALMKHSKNIQV